MRRLLVLVVLVGCSSSGDARPGSSRDQVRARTAQPADDPIASPASETRRPDAEAAPIVLKGSGGSSAAASGETDQERSGRVARLERQAAASQGRREDETPSATVSGPRVATGVPDHLADILLVQQGDRMEVQFKVVSSKGDMLEVPGFVRVYWLAPSKRDLIGTGARPSLMTDQRAQPEHLTDGTGRPVIVYRLDAIRWLRGMIRVEFTGGGVTIGGTDETF